MPQISKIEEIWWLLLIKWVESLSIGITELSDENLEYIS